MRTCDSSEITYDPAVEINNIVTTAEVGSSIPLEALTLEPEIEHSKYEPEQFPALRY